jgi:magnesium transporter
VLRSTFRVNVNIRDHRLRLPQRRNTGGRSVEPQWLDPASGVTLWVDVAEPTADEGDNILRQTFHFHPLSVEDALSDIHYPKIESYDRYLYVILHGIDYQVQEHWFATLDVDFFLADNYLVTVHDGRSRSIQKLKALCQQHARILEEGPAALMHRIIDSMVDNYEPELDELEREMDQLEEQAVIGVGNNLIRPILEVKRDLSALRRVLIPQRDALGRLARGSSRSSRTRWRTGSAMSMTTWCATPTK